MAPTKENIRTYSRDENNSHTVFKRTKTNPIGKKKHRRKKKIIIPELPPPSTRNFLLETSSFTTRCRHESTFDKLLNDFKNTTNNLPITSDHNLLKYNQSSFMTGASSRSFDNINSIKTTNSNFIISSNEYHSPLKNSSGGKWFASEHFTKSTLDTFDKPVDVSLIIERPQKLLIPQGHFTHKLVCSTPNQTKPLEVTKIYISPIKQTSKKIFNLTNNTKSILLESHNYDSSVLSNNKQFIHLTRSVSKSIVQDKEDIRESKKTTERNIEKESERDLTDFEETEFVEPSPKDRLNTSENHRKAVINIEQLDIEKIINREQKNVRKSSSNTCNTSSESELCQLPSQRCTQRSPTDHLTEDSATNQRCSTGPRRSERLLMKNVTTRRRLNDERLTWFGKSSSNSFSKVKRLEAGEEVVQLKPGKQWRRSLFDFRQEKRSDGIACGYNQHFKRNSNRVSIRIVPIGSFAKNRNTSVMEDFASIYKGRSPNTLVEEVEDTFDESFKCLSLNETTKGNGVGEPIRTEAVSRGPVTAKDILLRKCNQTELIAFQECYPNATLQQCKKIGEGVYGEVFLYENSRGGTTVMKVIPIEGDLIVNGERQKRYDEVLSEVTITMALNDLKRDSDERNRAGGFADLQRVVCVEGKYPSRLVDLWELYEESRGTENDNPCAFDVGQRYVVLELSNAGRDLESYAFNNATQACSVFEQAACSLAVAEAELGFEHRDLHWGNILVAPVDANREIEYRLNGAVIAVKSKGVEMTIIDYTLSRMQQDGVCIYNDLSTDDDLFTAHGDYQFEIYRLMRDCNKNEWQNFTPYTNILWLHYILDKMISAVNYKYRSSKIHSEGLKLLRGYKKKLLEFPSAEQFVSKCLMYKCK